MMYLSFKGWTFFVVVVVGKWGEKSSGQVHANYVAIPIANFQMKNIKVVKKNIFRKWVTQGYPVGSLAQTSWCFCKVTTNIGLCPPGASTTQCVCWQMGIKKGLDNN